MTPNTNGYPIAAETTAIQSCIDREAAVLALISEARDAAHVAHDRTRAKLYEAQLRVQELESLVAVTEQFARDADADYHAAVAEHGRWFHPLRRVPLEILGSIFEQCVFDLGYPTYEDFYGYDEYQDCCYPEVFDSQQLPFVLAAVCTSWRAAALSNARVWSYIDVVLDVESADMKWPPAWLALRLERSKSTPLHLNIHRPEKDLPDYRHMLESLRDVLPRVRFLNIQLRGIAQDDSLDVILGLELPNLEHFMLHSLKHDNAPSERWLRHVPRLKVVQEGHVAAPMYLPLAGQRKLLRPTSAHMELLLRDSPGLSSLAFFWPDLTTDKLTRRLQNATITELIIHTDRAKTGSDGLDLILSLPALLKLVLRGAFNDSSFRLQFIRHASIKFPQLLELDVSAIEVVHLRELFATLPDIPSLQTFTLRQALLSDYHSNLLFQALSSGEHDRNWPCPLLEHINLIDCMFDYTCTGADFLDFANSRISAASDDVRRLRRLRASGWNLEDRQPGPVFRDELDAFFVGP